MITGKAWDLWGGMTADTDQIWEGDRLPVWETWCGTDETFNKTCDSQQRPSRGFKQAAQLSHSVPLGGEAALRLVTFNKFNPSMAGFLAEMHAGPGGEYDYTLKDSLSSLNQAWPAGTPVANRKIQETPYVEGVTAAIETKPVMFLVKQDQLTPVPLWQGPQDSVPARQPSQGNNCVDVTDGNSANAVNCHPDPTTWLTCVLVDPNLPGAPADAIPVPATAQQIEGAVRNPELACESFLYIPISTIYHTRLDASEAAAFNRVQQEAGIQASAGDYSVLTAMHVNTKEIINWTWQTYWWQPGGDAPNDYPGNKGGMTDQVRNEWRNYAMCTAYNQTQGTTSSDIQICFNPFLETSSGIPDGLQSNCMSCHGTGTVGTMADERLPLLSYPSRYTTPIDFNNDPIFAPYTRTDFSWAIPGDARE